MSTKFLTVSAGQTKKIGGTTAKDILKFRPGPKAKVIGLVGDLGGGKTTFLQGFARGFGIKEKITSPTFVIMRRFKLGGQSGGFSDLYHIDCYRIQKTKELLMLGFKEIISNPKNIVAVEWADRIKKIIPREAVWIDFEFINVKTRKIVIR